MMIWYIYNLALFYEFIKIFIKKKNNNNNNNNNNNKSLINCIYIYISLRFIRYNTFRRISWWNSLFLLTLLLSLYIYI